MTKEQTLARLCTLVSKVGDKIFAQKESHDCFCGGSPLAGYVNFQMSEKVISYIEAAVELAMYDEACHIAADPFAGSRD